ncbi:Crp/Fnr family transcriptional regulator [Alteromonas sp. ASW11-36]|uniref:Crp/Fnr family transcriptional regulator n=1 Tax=Alteromonas arenosi TaxID=3055817 RepID=A0ABT7ST98_9ALTE|nr:Crp/Fnr family transcriptional regulator [Alteromonas sp. ASW11-36]MDM7859417.1 Crp/Fnr family transcriptional regulator [Alteromonas sp. ASW11-36]
MGSASHSSSGNILLKALSEESQLKIFPQLKRIQLPLGKVLFEAGQRESSVFFPIDSIVSLVSVMENGSSAEISIVGRDGLVGIAVFMGGESTLNRAVVQSAGFAYQLPAASLLYEFNNNQKTRMVLLRYTQGLIAQMTQTAVCNRHHSIDQQLCRWLLMSLDRVSTDSLIMTQELIANMLGVRREGVTEAAGKLQKLGVISYRRGHITILDRQRLETLCCECYATVKRETDRLEEY